MMETNQSSQRLIEIKNKKCKFDWTGPHRPTISIWAWIRMWTTPFRVVHCNIHFILEPCFEFHMCLLVCHMLQMRDTGITGSSACCWRIGTHPPYSFLPSFSLVQPPLPKQNGTAVHVHIPCICTLVQHKIRKVFVFLYLFVPYFVSFVPVMLYRASTRLAGRVFAFIAVTKWPDMWS